MDLNIDLGELPDEPEELYTLAHVANVACGGHAGDARSIELALRRCRTHGTRVGAHPSYPDREGFGRTHVTLLADALRHTVREQCRALADAARGLGLLVTCVKAHGALYHDAAADRAIADALILGAKDALGAGFTLLGPAAGHLTTMAREASVRFAREGFADRSTRADGTLVPRGQPGALIVDPDAAAARARAIVLAGDVETICVHGDTPGCVAIARAVRRALEGL